MQSLIASLAPVDLAAIEERALHLVRDQQQLQDRGGVQQLMHTYALSSQEGVALMCLAEALLRIPDSETMDRLIRDKICQGDWQSHLDRDQPLFVNAATWGLLITGKLVSTYNDQSLYSSLKKVLQKGSAPLVRKGVEFVMTLLGEHFVMGETIDEALSRSRATSALGYTHSFDMLGEAALTAADAQDYFAAYQNAIHAIGKAAQEEKNTGPDLGPGISVKLSALDPRYSFAQEQRVLDKLYPRLRQLAVDACRYNIGFSIDAEEADRLELSLQLFARLMAEPALQGWQGLGFVVQAYQKRAPAVVRHLIEMARAQRRHLPLRLVKGAYWDSEIKRAQIDGLPYPVFTRKQHSDVSYLACAQLMLDAAPTIYPQFATHNILTFAYVEALARAKHVQAFEFQCLHGMGESFYNQMIGAQGYRVRIYAPVGRHKSLLPYLVRRLLENGANSSFVHQITTLSAQALIADPIRKTIAEQGRPHPAVPLPSMLYGAQRANSEGVDLSSSSVVTALSSELATLRTRRWQAAPMLAIDRAADCTMQSIADGATRRIINPADHSDVVGHVQEATSEDVHTACALANEFLPQWQRTSATRRAQLLLSAAEALKGHRTELLSLCIREAGKTWANGVNEIREAEDFCRYYAAEIVRLKDAPPAHAALMVCISPWNFPLAIFIGQISAALAAGHVVLAKPAEQTPLIAAFAVSLFHQVGIPPAVLQLLPGLGETVGAALTSHPEISGVLFTGSLAAARQIDSALAQRPTSAPALLIAETGGLNAMIVDSSALAEQVVQDVLASGFDSAGQRCSALRLLYLQEEIADRVLDLLRQAMQELTIGDPQFLSTDIGPVINAEAQAALRAHIQRMRDQGASVFQLPCHTPHVDAGTFVAPTLIEISNVAQIEGEHFGPIVHVLRYRSDEMMALLTQINRLGYGLTFAVHSRIDETIGTLTDTIHAGNIYVNRNMVGAVVGVQPFGGEGLSGTGPKAGGPLMIARLMGLVGLEGPHIPLSQHHGDALTALADLAQWAQQTNQLTLLSRCQHYRAATLLGCQWQLPGPTGEDNRLRFFPRGDIWCVVQDQFDAPEQWLQLLAAVLATGNRALLPPKAADALHKLSLPPTVREHIGEINVDLPSAQACLYCGDESGARQIALQSSRASSDLADLRALCPLIWVNYGEAIPLYRLLCERSVSINTAAVGSNTGLILAAS